MAFTHGTLRSLLEMPLKSAPPRLHISNVKVLQVEHNKDNNEFTIDLSGVGKAFLNYEYLATDLIELYHTEVPQAARGQGVASLLVEAALKYVKENNLRAKVTCTYVQRYLTKNPDRQLLKHIVP